MSKDRAMLCLKRKDQETGLHYNRFRYYSPFVGRFVSKDPIGLSGGSNNYAYVPNPTSWVDPNGLTCQKYRRESLREIRRKLGIPMSQQPISQKMVKEFLMIKICQL